MITYGDFQQWTTECLHRNLEKIINAKSDMKTPYFILVIFKKGYNGPSHKVENTEVVDFSAKTVMHTRMIITNRPPLIKLIGTALWRIDNRVGEARCIYILPPDKPVMGTSFEDEKAQESSLVAESGRNMPLVYNS